MIILIISATTISCSVSQSCFFSCILLVVRTGPIVRLVLIYFLRIFQDLLVKFDAIIQPLVASEMSVLVDVFHRPGLLFPSESKGFKEIAAGGFLKRLERCVG